MQRNSHFASRKPAFLRSEFDRFGSRSGVNRALKALTDEGRLARIGYGIYAPAKNARLIVRESDAVLVALT